MTREETKQSAEVMIAFANGKKIECCDKGYKNWVVSYNPVWNWYDSDYRIAQDQEEQKETHYRPYTMEEFIADMRKHDGYVRPKNSDSDYYGEGYISIKNDGVLTYLLGFFTYKVLCSDFVWSDDGTPCGKEE